MRTATEQFAINETILLVHIKKIKTSIVAFELMHTKNTFEYTTLTHLQDDALSVMIGVEKYLLLQLMQNTDMPG